MTEISRDYYSIKADAIGGFGFYNYPYVRFDDVSEYKISLILKTLEKIPENILIEVIKRVCKGQQTRYIQDYFNYKMNKIPLKDKDVNYIRNVIFDKIKGDL